MPEDTNGWNEWSKHVLAELERLDHHCTKIRDEINKVQVEIATLKVKSGIWGAIGACIPISIGLFVYLLKTQISGS